MESREKILEEGIFLKVGEEATMVWQRLWGPAVEIKANQGRFGNSESPISSVEFDCKWKERRLLREQKSWHPICSFALEN